MSWPKGRWLSGCMMLFSLTLFGNGLANKSSEMLTVEKALQDQRLANAARREAIEQKRAQLEALHEAAANFEVLELLSVTLDDLAADLEELQDKAGLVVRDTAVPNADGLLVNGQALQLGRNRFWQVEDQALVQFETQNPVPLKNNPVAQLKRLKPGELATVIYPLTSQGVKSQAIDYSFWQKVYDQGLTMLALYLLGTFASFVAIWRLIDLNRYNLRGALARLEEAVPTIWCDGSEAEGVQMITGPIGQLVSEAVKHKALPIEFLEELLFEKILSFQNRLERWLPGLAVAATAAPLLGLLGTVNGMIQTFQALNSSGGEKSELLSAGISEALLTTEAGLLVAIPALLLHAFLNRKVKRVVGDLQQAAVLLMNGVKHGKSAD